MHLLVGSSAGRCQLDDVRFALADMKIHIADLGVADRQDAGNFAVAALATDGAELIVKLYGRDAYDAALVSTVWRTIWLRQPGAPVGFGRLRQVEHAALMTLLAPQAGIATDFVVTAGATATDDALLVMRRTGTPLVPPDRFRAVDEAPGPSSTMWMPVHDSVSCGNFSALCTTAGWCTAVRRGTPDRGRRSPRPRPVPRRSGGTVSRPGAKRRPTALRDLDRAVRTRLALEGLLEHRSVEEIGDLLPYLQPTALTTDQRRTLKVLGIDLDDLRSEVATAVGVEAPPLIQMRRFTFGSVMRVALPALAAVMLLSALAGFDFDEFVDSLQDAAWWLVAIGFVVAQLPRVAQAVSTLGAAPVPLPLGPVYALQLAISYVNLAIPTAAARIAVNVRFFQRQGLPRPPPWPPVHSTA